MFFSPLHHEARNTMKQTSCLLSVEHISFHSAVSLLQWVWVISSNWKAGPWRKVPAAPKNTVRQKNNAFISFSV